MKKLSPLGLVLILIAIPFIIGCQGSPSDDPHLPAGNILGINLEPGDLQLTTGESTKFIATGIFPGGASFDLTPYVSWITSNPSVAYFLSDGTVVAGQPGTATINAKFGNTNSQTITITVPGAPSPGESEVPVLMSITVTPRWIAVDEEGSTNFTATGNMSDGSTGDYTSIVQWRVSAIDLGYITPTGVFYSTGGSGVLTVSAKYGVYESNYAVVTINEKPAP